MNLLCNVKSIKVAKKTVIIIIKAWLINKQKRRGTTHLGKEKTIKCNKNKRHANI